MVKDLKINSFIWNFIIACFRSYMVALTLQEEQKKQDDNNKSWNEYKHNTLGVSDHITELVP